jgi:hypothetical protein
MKFVTDGIFYDTTNQAHFKLLKKVAKGGVESNEWEAEKMQKEMKDNNK